MISQNAVPRLPGKVRRPGSETWFLLGIFLIATALASLFPASGDDWAWGSSIGIERLDTWFQGYNGRYTGNLTVLALTRAGPLAPVVVAAVITLTLFLVLQITDNRTAAGYTLITVLFLAMPQGVWRQSVVWLAGFSNYATAGLCVLIFLSDVKRQWQEAPGARTGRLRLLAVLVLGVVSALFMEHVTLYLVAASAAALVVHRVRRGWYPPTGLAWCFSLLCGAILMFSNSAYRTAAGEEATYQRIGDPTGTSAGLGSKITEVLSVQAVTQNAWVNVTLVLLIGALLARTGARSTRLRTLVLVLLAGTVALTYALQVSQRYASTPAAFRDLAGAAALLLLAALLITGMAFVPHAGRRAALVGCSVSVLVLVAPLALVSPVGPRCFYPSYLLFLVLVSTLMKEVTETTQAQLWRLAPALGAIGVGLVCVNVLVYGSIDRAAERRLAAVREQTQSGADAVVVDPLPFSGFVHVPDPAPFPWDLRYKLYHRLPLDLTITVRPSPEAG